MSKTILCVTYDPSVSGLLGIHIRNLGYDQINAPSAESAKTLVERASLVISDISRVRGYELYDYIQTNHPSTPIILLDGGCRDPERAPKAHVLPKPFDPDDLAKTVRRLLAEPLKPDGAA
jgi:DNA-binding NtrC family response regulator